MKPRPCVDCGTEILQHAMGRPKLRCEGCRKAKAAAYQRAYRLAHPDVRRAWVDRNRESVNARQLAYKRRRKLRALRGEL